eukprot:scaffold46172_cov31-Tisochrysis_lutea.AAC.2
MGCARNGTRLGKALFCLTFASLQDTPRHMGSSLRQRVCEVPQMQWQSLQYETEYETTWFADSLLPRCRTFGACGQQQQNCPYVLCASQAHLIRARLLPYVAVFFQVVDLTERLGVHRVPTLYVICFDHCP